MTTTYPVEYSQTKEHRSTTKVLASSTPEDKVKMSVDADGAAHIMSLLTDLYSNPQEAVIREYVTNALDAHAEAGQTKPVEVYSPSRLSPQFVVKDYGTGMSLDDIKYVYSSYGRSTKRQDFTQIGAFGLGCKSALTLTSQFTLVSVKDGQSVTAVISRDEDGVGSVSITDVSDTAKDNGTTVTIPISDVYGFAQAVKSFKFGGFSSGSISVDGTLNINIADASEASQWLNGAIVSLPKENYYDREFVVMGGVTYPLSRSLYDSTITKDIFSSRSSVYFIVPVASVDLTPSREALRYTERTKNLISSLESSFISEFKKRVEEKVAECSTLHEALLYFSSLKEEGINLHFLKTGGTLVWNDTTISPYLVFTPSSADFNVTSFYIEEDKTSKTDRNINVDPTTNRNTYVISGDPSILGGSVDAYRRNFRKYLLNELDKKGESWPWRTNYVLHVVHGDMDDPFLDSKIVQRGPSFDEVKQGASEYTRNNRSSTTSTRGTSEYVVYTFHSDDETDTNYYLGKDIPKGTYYYQTSSDSPYPMHTYIKEFVDALGLDSLSVLYLPPTRKVETLLKRSKHPMVLIDEFVLKTVADYLEDTFDGRWKEYLAHIMGVSSGEYYHDRLWDALLPDDDIVDPEFKEFSNFKEELKSFEDKLSSLGLMSVIQSFNMTTSMFGDSQTYPNYYSEFTDYLSNNYPLAGKAFYDYDYYYNSDNRADVIKNVVDYINAMYLTRRDSAGTLD